MTTKAGPRRPAWWIIILVIAGVSLALRGPIVAVAPVIQSIQADLLLPASTAGTLTSLPVLCFALIAPLGMLLVRWGGVDTTITVFLSVVALGTVLRSIGGLEWAIVGTLVIGAGIAVGNVVMPVFIRRDVAPERISLTMGIYTAALNLGATLTSLGTAPLAEALGWQAALLCWLVLALIGLLSWVALVGPRRAVIPNHQRKVATAEGTAELFTGSIELPKAPPANAAEAASRASDARAARRGAALTTALLAVALGGQALSYYSVTAWLPSILGDSIGFGAESAGFGASLFQIAAIASIPVVPFLIARLGSKGTFLALGVLWISLPIGLILAPQLWILWGLLGGVAQGSGFTAVMVVVVRLSTSSKHAAKLSGIVQGVGYGIASVGPTTLGALHDATGAWLVPLLVVVVALLVYAVLGATAAARTVRAGR